MQVPLGTRETVGRRLGPARRRGRELQARDGRASTRRPCRRRCASSSIGSPGTRCAPKGSALAMGLKLAEEGRAEMPRVGVRLAGPPPKRITPRAGTRARSGRGRADPPQARARRKPPAVSAGVIDGLVDEGTLETVALPPEPVAERPDPDFGAPLLSQNRRCGGECPRRGGRGRRRLGHAARRRHRLRQDRGLFRGGRRGVAQDRQALILMPEIALTAQFLDRFARRFGVRPATWHSGVAGPPARAPLRRGRRGRGAGRRRRPLGAVPALCQARPHRRRRGARGRLQAGGRRPLPRPRHGGGARPDRGRRRWCSPPPRPRIETRVNVERGRYRHLALPERFGGRRLPAIRAVDLKREAIPSGRWISPTLTVAIDGQRGARASRPCSSSTAAAMRRSRSAAPAPTATSARTARPGSSSTASAARSSATIAAMSSARPQACIACGSARFARALRARASSASPRRWPSCFPDRRTIVLSSDFPGGTERLRPELAAIAAGEFDIVIGTQLVAKGPQFPAA